MTRAEAEAEARRRTHAGDGPWMPYESADGWTIVRVNGNGLQPRPDEPGDSVVPPPRPAEPAPNPAYGLGRDA